jgi:hypothetical protein
MALAVPGARVLAAFVLACGPDESGGSDPIGGNPGPVKVCDLRVSKGPWVFTSTTIKGDVEIYGVAAAVRSAGKTDLRGAVRGGCNPGRYLSGEGSAPDGSTVD